MSRQSRGRLTSEERESELVASVRGDRVARVSAEIAKHPARSYLGKERAPDPIRFPDERGALSVLEPLFSDYRLGFFGPPNTQGLFEVRRLLNLPPEL